MTITQMNGFTKTVTLDASGMGFVEFDCPVGQYWLPLSAHVATFNAGGDVPQCGVHITGAGSHSFSPDSLIDFTFAGNNDTTSLLGGNTVNPGQAVVAHFINGNADDTAILSMNGLISDTPPPFSAVPQTGNHFSGAPGAFGAPVGGQTFPAFFSDILVTIGVNGTFVLIPANPAIKLFLHTLELNIDPTPNFTTSFNIRLQDTTGFGIGTYSTVFAGATTSGMLPPRPPIDLKGLPMAKGAGVQLFNPAGNPGSVTVSGLITWNSAGG